LAGRFAVSKWVRSITPDASSSTATPDARVSANSPLTVRALTSAPPTSGSTLMRPLTVSAVTRWAWLPRY